MAAFARILAVWSQSSHFILNTTVFQRASLHPEVYQLVGILPPSCCWKSTMTARTPLDVLARRIGL
jgi:non-ribosomal peptide synthetase component F